MPTAVERARLYDARRFSHSAGAALAKRPEEPVDAGTPGDPIAKSRGVTNDPAPSSPPAPPSSAPKLSATDHFPTSEAATKATQQHSSPDGPGSHDPHDPHDVMKSVETSEKEQSKRDWEIIKKLVPNIWPKDDFGTKARVIAAVGLLIGGKVWTPRRRKTRLIKQQILNVQVPFFFKGIIDTLNITIDPTTSAGALSLVGTVIVGCTSPPPLSPTDPPTDGLARVGSGLFSELRNAIFASVAQNAIRRVARNVFTHLLNLDVGFHLKRQTGGLTRAIDRGTKYVPLDLERATADVSA